MTTVFTARCMKEKVNGRTIVNPQLRTIVSNHNKPRFFVFGTCETCGGNLSTTVSKTVAKSMGASGAGIIKKEITPASGEWSEDEDSMEGKGTESQAVGAEPLVYDYMGAPQPRFPFISVHRTPSGKLRIPDANHLPNDILKIDKETLMVGGSVLENKSPEHRNKMLELSKEIGHAVEKVYGGSPYFVGGAPGFVGGFVPALLGTLGASLLSPILSQLVGGIFGSGLVVPSGISVEDSEDEDESIKPKEKYVSPNDPEELIRKILNEIGIKP